MTDPKVGKVFFRRGIFVSSFMEKKVIMSIAEEEREGQGSNEPTWIRYVDFSNV